MNKEKIGFILIGIAALACIAVLLSANKIPQNSAYHAFSDTHMYFGVPNALNVISNLPFLIIGLFGVFTFTHTNKTQLNIVQKNSKAYVIFFVGVALVGLGSGYYHLEPNNNTLVWDRLPMTISFMALYSIIISEFISEKTGQKLLIPLLMIGLISVLYWWYTEWLTDGDLRLYILMQFFPMVSIPIILVFFKSAYISAFYYWLLLLTYVAAKFFEHFDLEIHHTLNIISGHTIKHALPVIGLWIILHSYKKVT